MNKNQIQGADAEGIELVFGLVGPTGVDLGRVCDALRSQLKAVQYETILISLSELISPYLNVAPQQFTGEYDRVRTLMDRGTDLRERTQQPDIVGRLGIAQIRAARQERTGEATKPIPRVAYIIRSFKRPEEVELFRQIYGKAFTLISCYSPRHSRIDHLSKRISSSGMPSDKTGEELAVQLIARDYAEEGRPLGQRVGRTFPLADCFVTVESKTALDQHLRRLVRLTFGDPYISPTRDEQAMFFAQAAALRSRDLSRQVGAAVVSDDGELVTTGCNEVPKFGGGLYWGDDDECARDFERGSDSNVGIKRDILEETIHTLRGQRWLKQKVQEQTDQELADDALFGKDAFLRDSQLYDVIEFGRAVHAEMAALSHAARAGRSVQNGRLFCTTFPCHICARHIVASGLRDVVFIEPYEKSRTNELYGDSISVEPHEPSPSRVNFRAFVGVAPRRYMDFFQMSTERKTDDGKVLDADAIAAKPRIRRIVLSYISLEEIVIRDTSPVPNRKGKRRSR